MSKKTNMKKTIKLNAEQAKALYEKDNDLRHTILHEFSDEELGIKIKPFTWYDLGRITGSYIDRSTSGITTWDMYHNAQEAYRDVAPTEKDAKSSRAKHMLLQLAKHYNDGETEEEWIDWRDGYKKKYCCFYNHHKNRYEIHSAKNNQMPIVHFKRRKDLQKCIADNPELWKDYLKIK